MSQTSRPADGQQQFRFNPIRFDDGATLAYARQIAINATVEYGAGNFPLDAREDLLNCYGIRMPTGNLQHVDLPTIPDGMTPSTACQIVLLWETIGLMFKKSEASVYLALDEALIAMAESGNKPSADLWFQMARIGLNNRRQENLFVQAVIKAGRYVSGQMPKTGIPLVKPADPVVEALTAAAVPEPTPAPAGVFFSDELVAELVRAALAKEGVPPEVLAKVVCPAIFDMEGKVLKGACRTLELSVNGTKSLQALALHQAGARIPQDVLDMAKAAELKAAEDQTTEEPAEETIPA